MISFIISLAFLSFFLWLGFHITGAFLAMLIWVCIKMPLALITWLIGTLCCCTIILIPAGIFLFKAGFSLLIPGRLI